jgi:hypothetical protein
MLRELKAIPPKLFQRPKRFFLILPSVDTAKNMSHFDFNSEFLRDFRRRNFSEEEKS